MRDMDILNGDNFPFVAPTEIVHPTNMLIYKQNAVLGIRSRSHFSISALLLKLRGK